MRKYITLLLLLTTSVAFAQKANFSGNWSIDRSRTDFGQDPAYVLPGGFNIMQQKKSITIIRTLLDDQLQGHPDTAKLNFKGKVFQTLSPSGKKEDYSLKWNDDQKSFVITLQISTPDNHPLMNITETWGLADDDKTLVINRAVDQLGGMKYTIKGYFKRL